MGTDEDRPCTVRVHGRLERLEDEVALAGEVVEGHK